jgi:CRP-like cAMP-binding protein
MPASWFPEARSGELVAYLDEAELARLLGATEVAEAGTGDFLLHKGSPSRSILLVEDGEIEIIDESLGDMVVLGRVGPGGVVGEVGFVDGQPRTHHVRAATACRVRRLTRDALLALAESDPPLFAKVSMALAELMARRFRAVLAELDPVRAFAASLGAPDETAVDDAVATVADGGSGDEAPDAPFEYDQIEDPLLDQAVDLLRELARRPSKDLAGV